jgi:tetratricopeptide (TPR) repeat protein
MPVSPLLLGLLPLGLLPAAHAAKDDPVTTATTAVPADALAEPARLKLWTLEGHPGLLGVRVKLGDQPYLFAVSPTLDQLQLGSAACAAAGASLDQGESWTSAKVDGIQLAGATLDGIEAVCVSQLSLPATAAQETGSAPLVGFDGVLGLGAFAALPWALQPAEGELVLGGGSVTGAAVAAGSAVDDARIKTEDTTYHLDGTAFPVPVALAAPGGQPAAVGAVLRDREAQSAVDARAVPEGVARRPLADAEEARIQLQLGDSTRTLWAAVETAPELVSQYKKAPPLPTVVVGHDALAGLAIGWDPASRRLTVGEGGWPTRSGTTVLAQRAAAELDAAKNPAEGAADSKAVGTAAQAHGKVLLAQGETAAALDAFVDATTSTPESCATWLELGRARRLLAPTPEAARTDLERSVELYEAWWQWDSEIRAALAEKVEKAEKEESAYTFTKDSFGFVAVRDVDRRDLRFGAPPPPLPADGTVMQQQPASCHVARTELATLDLLGEQHAAVEAHYAALDLDPGLARVAALSRLQQGQPAAAQAAARQAIKREHSAWDARSRALLALAKAAAGQDGRAAMDRALSLAPHDLRLAQLRLSLEDAETRLEVAETWARSHPESHAAAAVWLAESAAAGAPLKPALDAVTAARAEARSRGWSTAVADVHVALATGKLPEAAAAAEAAVEAAPLSAAARWAQAAVFAAQGDEAQAQSARMEARRLAPQHPGYAALGPAAGS